MKKKGKESALEEDEKGALISYWNRRGISRGFKRDVIFEMSLHGWLEIQKAHGDRAFTHKGDAVSKSRDGSLSYM